MKTIRTNPRLEFEMQLQRLLIKYLEDSNYCFLSLLNDVKKFHNKAKENKLNIKIYIIDRYYNTIQLYNYLVCMERFKLSNDLKHFFNEIEILKTNLRA